MSKSTATTRRNPLSLVVIAVLTLAVLAAVAWTATSSPALSQQSAATPTHARSFAFAEIVKPTYTALPTQIPTSLPTETPIPSPTPESVIHAEILVVNNAAPVINGQTSTTGVEPTPSYGGNKSILVDISEQHMYVYEGGTIVFSFVASTGMGNSTRIGTFSVLEKIPNAYGATWNIWMPNWLGIYWSGNLQNGIHALPILSNGATLWEGYLGTPVSFGCVVLSTYEAQLLYDWADVGSPVEIQR